MTNDPLGAEIVDGDDADVPGQSQFGPAVDQFDTRADQMLERLRGHPVADTMFATASHIGDFSLIWHGISIARAVGKKRPDQAVALALLLGAESLIVNQGIKRLFRRERPTITGDTRLSVRQPSTSAFPSGHASSALFAASVLALWDGRRVGALWFGVAAIVGSSRAYVRIHHASDVVGGALVGLGLAALARPITTRFR